MFITVHYFCHCFKWVFGSMAKVGPWHGGICSIGICLVDHPSWGTKNEAQKLLYATAAR